MQPNTLTPATFAIEFNYGEVELPGYTFGDRWNGWQCPHFTHAQGMAVVNAWNRSLAEYARFKGLDLSAQLAYYNADADEFVFPDEQADTGADRFGPVYRGTRREQLYPIGAWGWTWDEVIAEEWN